MTTTVPSTMIERSLATIASAATTDLSTTQSENVSVTGTTTITALGTVQAGAIRYVTFAGALTLTHNATSLILPSGASITTAAGDVATFISLGSGNWRCFNYMKASGQAVVAPAQGVTSVATGNGLSGGTITSTGTLTIAAPTQNTVGSYALVTFGANAINPSFGTNYSAGSGANQMQLCNLRITCFADITGVSNVLSGTWKWLSGQGTNAVWTSGIAVRVS